jgi:hypothetical protein
MDEQRLKRENGRGHKKERTAMAAKRCADCQELLDGARSPSGPHLYMAQFGEPEAGLYRCLVCDSMFTFNTESPGQRAKAASGVGQRI